MENIKAGMVTAAPVYVRNEEGRHLMLVKQGTALTDLIIGRLYRYHVTLVAVFSDEPAAALPLSKIKPIISENLATEALGGLQDLFSVAAGSKVTTAHRAVRQLDDVVDQLVETVSHEAGGLVHISHLKSHDDYTYHHSLSVAVLSIAIGRTMRLKKCELRELGRAAIMHDIGKILVPTDILNKPGKLTDTEFEIIKEHSAKGAAYLKKEGIGNSAMWDAIYAHHEKMDGTGYPSGLKGGEIPFFARIITVADVYDAVTSYRPYRGPMSPSVAFELLMSNADRAFEYNVVKAFAKSVEFYPIGAVLSISNGRIGMVVDNVNALRPTLRMLDNGEIVNLVHSDNLHLMIEDAN
jgi:putative nucleotidyltransferase with HDIG domain